MFDPEDVRETVKLDSEQRGADEVLEARRVMIVFGSEGWMPAEYHEEAMTRSKQLKGVDWRRLGRRRSGLR